MPSFSSIRPTALGNNLNHKTLSKSTRNDGEDPARRTQVIESPKTLSISYNESLSKDGAPPLLETPNGAPSFSSCACGCVEPSCTDVEPI
jgi:hypothetical protein